MEKSGLNGNTNVGGVRIDSDDEKSRTQGPLLEDVPNE